MESFKTGAGALSVANSIVELSIIGYLAKKSSETASNFVNIANEQKTLHNNINQILQKLAEDGKGNSHFKTVVGEQQKILERQGAVQKQLCVAVNELSDFRNDIETRLDRIEQCMEAIISTLSEKEIVVPQPKPKPISWFKKQTMESRREKDKEVSFGRNNVKNIPNNDDYEETGENEADEEDDDDDRRALLEFRRAKNKNKRS